MKEKLFGVALAVGLAVASGSDANAALVQPASTLNLGSGGNFTGIFGNTDVATATFSDTFQIAVSQPGFLSVSLSEVAPNPENNVEFTSAALNGSSLNLFSGPNGEPDFGSLMNLAVSVGTSLLTILGTSGGNGVYAGTIAFSPAPPAVPLPGALLLMGTVLAGGAGFVGLRKRTTRASVAS